MSLYMSTSTHRSYQRFSIKETNIIIYLDWLQSTGLAN